MLRLARSRRPGAVLAVTAALVLTISACSSDSSASGGSSAGPSEASSAAAPSAETSPSGSTPASSSMATTYPVTITDCGGRQTTYDKAPERVVTLDPAVTEALLLLGLRDRIVGFTEFQTPDQRWAPTKADMDSLKVINKDMNYPSKEAVVAENPDLVTSIYQSALVNNESLPDREGWAELGINTYLTLGDCIATTEPVTNLDALYEDLTNFGILFDVQERAQAEIAKLQERVAAISTTPMPETTVWTYSGEKDPYPAGALTTPNAVITMAGATNAFGDVLVPEGYVSASWEEIVARDPRVIWIMSSAGAGFVEEAEGIMDALANDPRLTDVDAVKNKRYVVISYNEGGVTTPRNVDAIEQMAAGLQSFQ